MELKQRHFINLHKILTPFVILAMMRFYDNYTIGPLIYFGLHTGYCICWLLKELIYPDKSFDEMMSLPQIIAGFFVIDFYWIAPYCIISSGLVPHTGTILVSIPLCLTGFFFHFGADAQKYFTLKAKKGLITNGFFATTRNPNYLGEVLTYLGWGMLAESIIPIAILCFMATILFYPGMKKKDESMARYEEFADYKKRSNMLLPRIF